MNIGDKPEYMSISYCMTYVVHTALRTTGVMDEKGRICPFENIS